MTTRSHYEPPTVQVIGDVQTITAGDPSPMALTDAAYPRRTPTKNLRFKAAIS